MHPKDLFIADYTYDLPEEKIAKYPLRERDASRLLIYEKGRIIEDFYCNIDLHLPEGSALIFNDTKVIEARLLFQKATGGVIEIFCLEPGDDYPDITTAMLQKGRVAWKCLVGGASKWKPGQVLSRSIFVNETKVELMARYLAKASDHFIIDLSWAPAEMSFAEILHAAGAIPLPPYVRRAAEPSDAERYQTIYASHDGSVAAPTAGLHFTDDVFRKLRSRNITSDFVTLHVGAGTFKPVKTATIGEHEMHAEFIDVTRTTVENILRDHGRIIAVGTTSLRTLESLYWFGVKLVKYGSLQEDENGIPFLHQWEPYDSSLQGISPRASLEALLKWMDGRRSERLIARTQILMAPGYKPAMIRALVTNFHQPGSTLLLLVAALIGADWKKVYDYALRHDFRFLSYGDGNLYWVGES